MEQSFKKDVLREVREGDGRILLHDEVEERPNVFSIIPIWENVTEDDIMTPRDVFELIKKEGYRVCTLLKLTTLLCFSISLLDRLRTCGDSMSALPFYQQLIPTEGRFRPTNKHPYRPHFHSCWAGSNPVYLRREISSSIVRWAEEGLRRGWSLPV